MMISLLAAIIALDFGPLYLGFVKYKLPRIASREQSGHYFVSDLMSNASKRCEPSPRKTR